MNKKKTFPFRVKEQSYDELCKVLRFPEVTGPEIDGQICRVRSNTYELELSLKKEYLPLYSDDTVYQIELFEKAHRHFIVLASMLEQLEEPVV